MIFLPNSNERYISALRNHLHNFILKNGLSYEKIKLLKIINIYEALFLEDLLTPINIRYFTETIIKGAKYILTLYDIDIKINIFGNKQAEINIKAYRALLLLIICNLTNNSLKISVVIEENILIKVVGVKNNKIIKKLCKILNGVYYIFNNKMIINLPAKSSTKEEKNIDSEWHQISNPLSPVNVFLNDLILDY